MSGHDEAPSGLDEVFRWFQGELFRRNAPEDEAPPDPTWHGGEVASDTVITPSWSLSSEERLGIYAGAYFARLHEILAKDFEAVRHLVGAERFEELARRYVTRLPSRHYSLNYLGDRFPAFLESEITEPRHELLADLADVELAMTRVIDDEEVPSLRDDEFARLSPEQQGTVRLRSIPACRLFASRYRVNPIISAVKRELPLPDLAPCPTPCAVYRFQFRVTRLDLSPFEHALLGAFQDEGATLLEAVEAAAASYEGEDSELGEALFAAFRKLVAEGLFRSLED